jgi:geranylgeranyl reductase family protein
MDRMQPSQHADVVVVGAGPAGSAAAITSARLGRSVIVIDKATFPRDKCCGDGLTTAALRRLHHLGLDPTTVKSWEPVGECVVVATDGFTVDLPLPADGTQFAASATRTDLDAALVDLARAEGATVLEGHGVQGVQATPNCDGVQLDLDNGHRVTARYVIAADGAWSPVRKAIGMADPGYLGDWQAGRQYFANVGEKAKKLWVWFEPDMVPGYAWSFPLAGDIANVGYGVIRRPGEPLGELKGQPIDFLSRPHIAEVLGSDASPASGWKAWPIPARIGARPATGLGGRVLFAGDAARACDPMTGEGIAQALETAEMAARAICAAGPDDPERASKRYQRQLRWGMSLDDRLARSLSAVLAHNRGSAKALRIVDTNEWCRRNFVRWMFEDYPRAALATPHRWHRHMFGQSGAYRAD